MGPGLRNRGTHRHTLVSAKFRMRHAQTCTRKRKMINEQKHIHSHKQLRVCKQQTTKTLTHRHRPVKSTQSRVCKQQNNRPSKTLTRQRVSSDLSSNPSRSTSTPGSARSRCEAHLAAPSVALFRIGPPCQCLRTAGATLGRPTPCRGTCGRHVRMRWVCSADVTGEKTRVGVELVLSRSAGLNGFAEQGDERFST